MKRKNFTKISTIICTGVLFINPLQASTGSSAYAKPGIDINQYSEEELKREIDLTGKNADDMEAILRSDRLNAERIKVSTMLLMNQSIVALGKKEELSQQLDSLREELVNSKESIDKNKEALSFLVSDLQTNQTPIVNNAVNMMVQGTNDMHGLELAAKLSENKNSQMTDALEQSRIYANLEKKLEALEISTAETARELSAANEAANEASASASEQLEKSEQLQEQIFQRLAALRGRSAENEREAWKAKEVEAIAVEDARISEARRQESNNNPINTEPAAPAPQEPKSPQEPTNPTPQEPTNPTPQEPFVPEIPKNSNLMDHINASISQMGNYSYVLGGTGPTVFDCSGLTQTIFGRAGISLPRVANSQYISSPNKISYNDLIPGDLVFWSNAEPDSIYHVAIYIGNDRVFHASTPEYGVTTESIHMMSWANQYYARY